MPWSWSQIETEWLQGGTIAARPNEVTSAFETVERLLGGAWIESARTGVGGGWLAGPIPTLSVVVMGQMLDSLDGALGADALVARLRRREPAAQAELTAIHLLKSQRPDASIEIAPPVLVDDRMRVPDFRTRLEDSAWTYVEVAQPVASQAEQRVKDILQRLTGRVTKTTKSFALEVFMRREPTDQEVAALESRILEFCQRDGQQREDLGDLGLLLLNHHQPGAVVLETPPGEDVLPRLGAMQGITGPSELTRHIVVRIPFSDERAERFVTSEARQLPKEYSGLLMFGISDFKTWEPLLKRRLQPDLHTRVSGICLWGAGFVLTTGGNAWLPRTRLLVNRHAKQALPDWIVEALRKHPPEFPGGS
jgi:hypothetical protein